MISKQNILSNSVLQIDRPMVYLVFFAKLGILLELTWPLLPTFLRLNENVPDMQLINYKYSFFEKMKKTKCNKKPVKW